MWQEERQQKIRSLLAAYGQVSIDRVVDDFGVSRETIRRDLMEMELAGELRRVRGGAVPFAREDTTFGVRITLRLQEKRTICATALGFLESGQPIFMDAGSTSSTMAEALAGPTGLTNLTIITNSIDVASQLAEKPGELSRGTRIIMLAGNVKQDPMETYGEKAGATTIDIEPIREWTDESKTSLWPQVADLDDLHHVLTELIRLKTGGASLETSEHKIRGMLAHFRREKVEPDVSTCRVGLRTIGIDSKGIVRSCSHFAPLGDISRQSAREIWTGATARKLRREMVACRRGCVYGCQASKSLLERARRGLMVFGNSSP